MRGEGVVSQETRGVSARTVGEEEESLTTSSLVSSSSTTMGGRQVTVTEVRGVVVGHLATLMRRWGRKGGVEVAPPQKTLRITKWISALEAWLSQRSKWANDGIWSCVTAAAWRR